MKRVARIRAVVLVVALLATTTVGSGCRLTNFFSDNFSLSIIIPLGLDGFPGVLNPFGIFTSLFDAIVNPGGSSARTNSPGGSTIPGPLIG